MFGLSCGDTAEQDNVVEGGSPTFENEWNINKMLVQLQLVYFKTKHNGLLTLTKGFLWWKLTR